MLVVRFAVLPTAEENANPFKSQCSYHSVMLFRFVTMGVIKGLGPSTAGNSLAGELLKGLAGELLTRVPYRDPIGFAAGDVHGSDAAVA